MGRVRKAVGALVGATAVGQIILFGTSILVARLFAPSEVGVFVSLTAIAGILGVVISGRFELAIPLPRDDGSALLLAKLAVGLPALFGLFIAIALWSADKPTVADWLSPALTLYWAVPVLCLAGTAFQVGNHMAVRAQLYNSLAVRSVTYPAVAGATQVLFGLGGAGANGLILGIAIGQLAAFAVTWIPARKALQIPTRGHSSFRRQSTGVGSILRQYWRFPAFMAPAGALNVLATQAPVLIMSAHFGLGPAGQFGMAMKLAAVPVALIGASVGYIYAGELSRISRDRSGSATRLMMAATVRLGVIAVLAFGAVTLLAEPVVNLVLGSQWTSAGIFVKLMAIGLASQLLVAPLSQTLSVAGAQLVQLVIDAARVALIGAAAIWSISRDWDPEGVVLAMTIGTAVGYLVMWVANIWAARRIDSLAANVNRAGTH